MAFSGLKATVLPATTAKRERLPERFGEGVVPVVAVLLPSARYVALMAEQAERSFTYHLLEHASYSIAAPISFDADTFVEAVLAYCRHHRPDGILSPMSQMLGAGLATAGAVAGAAAVVAFGSDGNAPDWQVKGFKQARDVVTGLAVGYESILLVGSVFVSWIPPGAHLIVLLPVVFGLAFEVLVYFKT